VSDASVLVQTAERIGTVTLNRPERLNALDGRLAPAIADAVERLGEDAAVRVIVITGAGRAFCAGADVQYLGDLLERGDVAEAAALVRSGDRVVHAIRDAPKPVIGAVNGPAAGGGANLALACDLRIASEHASIGQTFNRIGLAPDWGGTYLLPRLVGPARAAELIFTGRMVDAAEAERLGLFNRVVPEERFADEVRALARTLAAKPPRAIARAKAALLRSLHADLDEMLEHELRAQTECFATDDAREGVRAFLEKREPHYRGT
jgi:2-(1,2-epoxy-1,2-dihydrophenyl)acetyl-CoA isomerase